MAEAAARQRDRRGLALPAIRIAGGYFASKDRYDTAWGDLLLAIFTPINTRPGNRRFGSALATVLFEPDLLRRQHVVRYIIGETARRWCPHIKIRRTLVKQPKNRSIQLWISFHLTDEQAEKERMVELTNNQIKVLAAGGN
ncbi:hypothetical protein LCGC14_0734480 [marine sediment metagenome]|uniref:IraD/Gp25-like domain-containing protein n=1 Tax=marine sediment metagenome TaxID=412755 RepID=A0A0F9QCS5_9ZZZZ